MTKKKIPYHIGIIMDGNRRWAKERDLPTLEGHFRGYEKVKEMGKWCRERGVKILTLWAFSTENWRRSKKEVSYLMDLLIHALGREEIEQFHKQGVKIQVIGQKEKLGKSFQKAIKEAEALTKNNKGGIVNLAISYGGRAEITEAVKRIVEKRIPANKITEKLIDQNIWTAGMPYPDLIIRTGGEMRTSGFLIWQSPYSELYFSKKHWPAFSEGDLDKAIADYGRRKRNFGK